MSTRRQFLKRTATVSAGAMGLPYFVPSSALGKSGSVAPSNRIVMGCIGTGGKGTGNMKWFMGQKTVQVVAVCDVDSRHRNRARGLVNKHYDNHDCKAYTDFRELVARKDLNAMSIGTPDHWHALTSIAAAKAGMHVYCEKPLANSVGESRAICDAVTKNNVVLQNGSHERSRENVRFACEIVRNGRIGEIKTVRINLPCSDGHHKKAQEMNKQAQAEMPVPKGFDYDMWLGHTAKVPYTKNRCHFWWRFILSYGGGEMTDRGAHVIDLAQLGLDVDDTGPVEYKARGKRSAKGLYNAFFDYEFENVYANGVRMIGTTQGPRGLKFEGSEGWIFIHVHGGKLEAEPASLLKEKTWPNKKIDLGRASSHQQNFLDAIKTGKAPFATAEIGHRTATICHLNNIGMVVGRDLKWDPKKEQIIGDEEASKLLTPKMRAPWHL